MWAMGRGWAYLEYTKLLAEDVVLCNKKLRPRGGDVYLEIQERLDGDVGRNEDL